MTFDYYTVKTFMGSLEISDIGNFFIRAYNDKGKIFYLWIKTKMGITKILEQGPLDEYLEDDSNLSFKKIEFNDKTIKTTIKSFLNNPKYKITQAIVEDIDDTEIIKFFKDFTQFFTNF